VIDRASLTVVLFDIDGTLLNIHGAGKRAFSRALEELFGWHDELAYINFAGATDRLVFRRVVREHGQAVRAEDERRFFEALPRHLERLVRDAPHTLHRGVRRLLGVLHEHPRSLVGLVTGNIESCAHIKLDQFGLGAFFDFGGYGSDHENREEIARIALARARERLASGQRIGSVFLVGDALSDVAAAKAVGAQSLAVTTGWHGRDELMAAGADAVLNDLSELDRILSILGLKQREG